MGSFVIPRLDPVRGTGISFSVLRHHCELVIASLWHPRLVLGIPFGVTEFHWCTWPAWELTTSLIILTCHRVYPSFPCFPALVLRALGTCFFSPWEGAWLRISCLPVGREPLWLSVVVTPWQRVAAVGISAEALAGVGLGPRCLVHALNWSLATPQPGCFLSLSQGN